MRKLLVIILASLSLLIKPTELVFAENKFARILESTNLYKYSNTSNEISNIICIAEKSYFVEIIGEINDLYKVNYNGMQGYVKKNDVKEITNTPSTPYPYNIKLTIGSDCNLRSSPTIKSQYTNIITTLNAGENNFTFIGRIFSDEAIDFGGTTWYLVNYNGEYGYIYNKYIKSITPIYENTEEVNFKSEKPITTVNPITHSPTLVIIILLFIPCIVLLLILYLPRKIKTHRTKEIKEIYKY